MNAINYRNARNTILQEYKDEAQRTGKPVPRIVPGHVRLEQQMTILSQTYKFPILNEGTPFNTELRLNLNDNFHATEVGLWVAKPASATSAIFRTYSYANVKVFSTANVAGGIDMLFNNSNLFINVNKDQYVFNFSTSTFQKRGDTQEGSGFGASTAAGTPTMVSDVQDAWDGNENGYADLGTIFKFGGRSTNDISIQMPSAPAAVETYQRVILMFRGFYAINAAQGQ